MTAVQHKKNEIYRKIEEFIDDYIDSGGVSPTMRDIAEGIGVSASTVCKYISSMEEQGTVRCDGHRKVITKRMQSDMYNHTRTPLMGETAVLGLIACGEPDSYEEQRGETFKLPKAIFGDGPLFMLKASGESMIDAGIDDGDLVVVKQQETAEPGQIVVALVDGKNTLKGYFPEKENRRIRLQPANSTMQPMYYPEVIIQGVAVKVIKGIDFMRL